MGKDIECKIEAIVSWPTYKTHFFGDTAKEVRSIETMKGTATKEFDDTYFPDFKEIRVVVPLKWERKTLEVTANKYIFDYDNSEYTAIVAVDGKAFKLVILELYDGTMMVFLKQYKSLESFLKGDEPAFTYGKENGMECEIMY